MASKIHYGKDSSFSNCLFVHGGYSTVYCCQCGRTSARTGQSKFSENYIKKFKTYIFSFVIAKASFEKLPTIEEYFQNMRAFTTSSQKCLLWNALKSVLPTCARFD